VCGSLYWKCIDVGRCGEMCVCVCVLLCHDGRGYLTSFSFFWNLFAGVRREAEAEAEAVVVAGGMGGGSGGG
jgi:hypothetical protein